MQVRGLLVGVVLLAILSGAVWWSQRNEAEKESNPSTDNPKLISVKEDQINRVEIARRDEAPTVLQKEKDGWSIAAPAHLRADSDTVSTVVSSFTGLTQDRLVDDKTADLTQFGLAQPSVRIAAGGKTLLIGDETPTGGGYFAKLEGDPRVFTIAGPAKTSLDKDWKDLQDKRLLRFEEGKLTRVEVSGVEFGRNAQNEWQIVRPKPARADNWAVEELVRKLKDARMDTAAEVENAAQKYAAGTRAGLVTITDSSGSQTLEVHKSGDDYFAKSSLVEGIHKVPSDLADALKKSFDDYRNKKLFDFGFNDPAKVSVRHGDQWWHFTKGGEKWWLNGREMDSTSVQSLIDKLRELTATGFAEGSPPPAVMDVSVTAKSTEKVSFAASGMAQREGDPSLYKIDPKTIEDIRKAAAEVKPPPPPAAKK